MAKKTKEISNAQICRGLVNQLEGDLIDFRDACLKIPAEDVNPELRKAIFEIGSGIIHFINNYRMTDTSISDFNKRPGRSKNHRERDFFRAETESYQINKPGGFLPWKTFAKKVDKANSEILQKNAMSSSGSKEKELFIEERTYDLWKREWKDNKFTV